MKRLKQASIVLACAAVLAFFGYQIFRLTVVTIDGVSPEQAQRVQQLLPYARGDCLLGATEEALLTKLNLQGEFICEQVQIRWPNQIYLRVLPRSRIGYVELGGGFAVIGQDGYVMAIEALRPGDLAEIQGLGVTSCKVGQLLEPSQQDRFLALAVILSAMHQEDYGAQISVINVIKSTWLTVTTHDGVVCTLGMSSDMADKFRWIRAAMEQLRTRYDAQALYGCRLDVSTGKSAVFTGHQPVVDPMQAEPTQAPEQSAQPDVQ